MKRPLIQNGLILFFTLFLTSILYGEVKPIGFAISFPDFTLSVPPSKEVQSYLGITFKKKSRIRDFRGDLFLIEYLNIYCVNCIRQAPILNEVFRMIEKDSKLSGRIKLIGIAAGNTSEEVNQYKKENEIPYPIFSDPNFDAHQAVGSPRTPFMIWVRKDKEGRGVVVSTHLGLIDSPEKIIAETKAVLQYDLALLKPKRGMIYEEEALSSPLSEEELIKKAKTGMEASGGRVLEIRKVLLKDKDSLYVGKVDFGDHQKYLFSKLASRRAVCDICHDTFFIYTFDSEGKLVDLVPIQLTKIDNLNWSDEDIKRLKNRVLGKSIFKTFAFDPNVDSISGATITSVLIFDSLEKAKEVYEKLKKEGYIKN